MTLSGGRVHELRATSSFSRGGLSWKNADDATADLGAARVATL